jgi:hypothetical protein
MIARLRTRLEGQDPEGGLTLAELMVASFLTLLILVMVGTMFANTAQLTASANQNRNSTSAASNMQNEFRNVIGLAAQIPVSGSSVPLPPISLTTLPTASSLVIYALIDTTDPANPAPTRVTFTVNAAGTLVESRCVAKLTSGYWTFTSCASTSTRKLGGAITAPTGSQLPLFTYLDGNDTVLPLSAGSLPAASAKLVASITVSVKVLAPGAKTAPVYLSSTIGMPNIGLQQGS